MEELPKKKTSKRKSSPKKKVSSPKKKVAKKKEVKKQSNAKIEKFISDGEEKTVYVEISIPFGKVEEGKEPVYHGLTIREEFVDEVVKGLKESKKVEAKEIPKTEEDLKYEEFREKKDKLEKKWFMKVYNTFKDVGIQITPFDWGFSLSHAIFATKTIAHNGEKMFQCVNGALRCGPITFIW